MSSAQQDLSLPGSRDAAAVAIPDAHLLFNAEFKRTGDDLRLAASDGNTYAVPGYFKSEHLHTLLSPDGAALSGDIVSALAGAVPAGKYAALDTPSPQKQVIGHAVKVDGNVSVVRNGVVIALHDGEVLLKGDVVQTDGHGAVGLAFNDGSAFQIGHDSRLVLSEFSYDPHGSANVESFDLVQGSFSFASGRIAHSGDMRIGTPVGAEKITGSVGGEVSSDDGSVTLSIFHQDDGQHQETIYDRNGNAIATISSDGGRLTLKPIGPAQISASEMAKTDADLSAERDALNDILQLSVTPGALGVHGSSSPPSDFHDLGFGSLGFKPDGFFGHNPPDNFLPFEALFHPGNDGIAGSVLSFVPFFIDHPPVISSAGAAAIDEGVAAHTAVYKIAATDAIGATMTYSLVTGLNDDAAAFSVDASTGVVTINNVPDFEIKPFYDFTVKASDASGHFTTQAVKLTINDLPPVISSGALAAAIDEATPAHTPVYTAVAADPAGGTVTYSLVSDLNDDAAAFHIDASTGVVTINIAPDFETRSSYAFTVKASDAFGDFTIQAVTLAVNDLPPAVSSATTATVDEGSAALSPVYTAIAADPAGGTVRYSLVSGLGDDAAAFHIDASTGVVTIDNVPDFEIKSSYDFTVKASDPSGNSTTQAVTLSINDLPPVINSGASANVDEAVVAHTAVYTAVAADPAGGAVTYSLVSSLNDDAAAFSIDPSTGVVTINAIPYYETQASYHFTVKASDPSGKSSIKAVTLSINDLPPKISSGALATAIDEGTAAHTAVYTAVAADPANGAVTYALVSGLGDDAAAFSIDELTGVVRLNAIPDYETQSSYSFTVEASDASGKSATQTVSLAINDLPPVIGSAASATAIDEGSPAYTAVYAATATDPASGTVTWSLVSGLNDDAAAFRIDPSTGIVTIQAIPNYEAQSSYHFTVEASDASGKSTTQTVTLAVNDLAPAITSGAVATAIDEGASIGTPVYTATAADPAGGTVTYALVSGLGDDAAAFTIDPMSGQVKLNAIPNYENQSSYGFNVEARDASGKFTTQAVTLSINDLPPVMDSPAHAAINEGVSAGTLVYTAHAVDPAGGAVTYSLVPGLQDDAAAFTIDQASGKVTIKAIPDFETQASYSFTVAASDASGHATPQTVTLVINDLPPAIISGATAQILVGAPAHSVVYTAAATDPAGGAVTYSLVAGLNDDASAFSIDANGVVTINNAADFGTRSAYSFTLEASDASGASTTRMVAVSADVSPTLAPVVAGTLSDTAAHDSFQTISGVLLGNDADAGETVTLTYAVLSGVHAVNTAVAGQYGTLTVGVDGSYSYVPNAVAINALPAGNFTDRFTVQTTDVHGATATTTFTVNVTGADDAPVVTAGNPASYSERGAAVAIGAAITVTDPDSTTFTGATATISSGYRSGDTLTINGSTDGNIVDAVGTIHYHYDSVTHTMSLSGLDTAADYQAALHLVSFSNTTDVDPTAGGADAVRTVSWTVGNALTSAATSSTINVTAVNNAPTATALTTLYNTAWQAHLSLQNTGLSVGDVDGSSGTETATLAVGEGNITVSAGNSGVTDIIGNGTGSVSFSGTIAEINALLGSSTGTVVYIDSVVRPSAATTLTLTVDDNGHTGGGALYASVSSTIDVAVPPTPPTYLVTSAADTTADGTLRSAVTYANAHPGTVITFSNTIANQTITLTSELPLIEGNATVIDGGANHITVSGNDQYRLFFIGDNVSTIGATIENLTLAHGLAKGGNGAGGGGGGAGFGGAVFVSNGASLSLNNANLVFDAAHGGDGSTRSIITGAFNTQGNIYGPSGAGGGGGGGMGGNGSINGDGSIIGPVFAFFPDYARASSGGGGGGFGVGANGGNVNTWEGSAGAFTGGASGGGGGVSTNLSSGGAFGGGGGAGAYQESAGGGGGVGGGQGTSTFTRGPGDPAWGNPFGGNYIDDPGGSGGHGGFGGGGGGAVGILNEGNRGGDGGFGGGGGGGAPDGVTPDTGGNGGFGGGGGADGYGGFGGGNGKSALGLTSGNIGGGGGAGAGGGVFVETGGTLTIGGTLSVNGNTVAGGSGSTGGADGSAFGSGIFFQGTDGSTNTLTFGAGVQSVSNVIADYIGSGGTNPSGGADAADQGGSMALLKIGGGTLTLSAVNTYTGSTTVSGSTLQIDGSIAKSAVIVESGGVLDGTGITGAVTVQSGGIVAPGDSGMGALKTGDIALQSGATYAVELGGAASYDTLDVIGTVSLNGASLSTTLINSFAPTVSSTFEIINNDGNDVVSGTFAGLAEGASVRSGNSVFKISYVGGDGNDVTLTAAPTYLVTSTADTTGVGTLRSAILFANAHPGTVIVFDSAIANSTIVLTSELPAIDGDGTIIDGGANNITVSGNNAYRMFSVGDGTSTVGAIVENLTIANGLARGGAGGINGGDGAGGGIFVSTHASLSLVNANILSDSAVGGDGAVSGGDGLGGGVYVESGGALTFGGALTVNGDTATGGTGANPGGAFGGAIFYQGTGGTTGTLSFGAGTQSVNGAIADDSGSGGTSPNGGSMALVKAGGGTLTLSGIDTYTGSTTVAGSTLQVDGSITNSAVTVQSGGVLDGIGATGAVTIQSGGTIAAGDAGIGQLSTGSLSLQPGGTLAVEIGSATSYDKLNVTGAVSLNGATLSPTLLNSFAPDRGIFEIISNDGTDPVNGTFAGLAEGATFALGGQTWRISYVGGDGNDVTLTAAPPTAVDQSYSVLGTRPSISGSITSGATAPLGDALSVTSVGYGGTAAVYNATDKAFEVQGTYGRLYVYAQAVSNVTVGSFVDASFQAGDFVLVVNPDASDLVHNLAPGATLTDTFSYTITDSVVGSATTATATFTYVDSDIFTNVQGGSWTDPGNWMFGVPSASLDAVVNQPGAYAITLGTSVTAASLTISNANAMLEGTGTLAVASGIGNSGTIVASGGTLTLDAPGGITNSGSLVAASGATLTLDAAGGILNEGVLAVTGNGIMQFDQTVTNLSGSISIGGSASSFTGTLSAGSIDGSGDIDLDMIGYGELGDGVHSLALTINGLLEASGGTLLIPGTTAITDNALLSVASGSTLEIDSVFASGQLLAGSGAAVYVAGNLSITQSVKVDRPIYLNGGAISGAGGMSGAITGTGTVAFTRLNAGIITAYAGTIDVAGTSYANSGTKLLVDFFAGQYFLSGSIASAYSPTGSLVSAQALSEAATPGGIAGVNNPGQLWLVADAGATLELLTEFGSQQINSGAAIDAFGTVVINMLSSQGTFLNQAYGGGAIIAESTVAGTAPGTVELLDANIAGGIIAGSVAGGNDLFEIVTQVSIGSGAEIINATMVGNASARLQLGGAVDPSTGQYYVGIANSTISAGQIVLYGIAYIAGDTTLTGQITSHLTGASTPEIVVNQGVTLTLSNVTGVAGASTGVPIVNNGTIEISGVSQISGAITGGGGVRIDAGGTLEFQTSQTTANVTFAGSTGTLQIDDLGTTPQAIYHIQGGGAALPAGDVIDLVNIAFNPAADSYNANTGVITVGNGTTASVTIDVTGGVASGTAFAFQSDGHGGTKVVPSVAPPTISAASFTLTSFTALSGASDVTYAGGEVYVSFSGVNGSQIEAFGAHGTTQLWTQTWSGGNFYGIATDGNYVYGVGTAAGTPLIVRFAADDDAAVAPLQFDTSAFGNIRNASASYLYGGGFLFDAIVTPQHGVYAVGYVETSLSFPSRPVYAAGEYDSNGVTLATADFVSSNSGTVIQSTMYGVADWNGGIWMVGSSFPAGGAGISSSTYAAVWTQPYGLDSSFRASGLFLDTAAGLSSNFNGVATIGNNLYAVGYNRTGSLIADYHSDGTLAWNVVLGSGELTDAVAVRGRLFVVGESSITTGGPLRDVLMEINPLNGVILSTIQTDTSVSSSSITSDGNYLYVITKSGLHTYEMGGATTTFEDTAVVMHGISVADDTSGSSQIEVTLASGHGSVALHDGSGLDSMVTGNGSVELFGSVAEIDAALANGVIYNPTLGYTGADALTITVNDQGHNALSTPLTVTQTVALTVTPASMIADGATFTLANPSSDTFAFATDHGTFELAQPGTFTGEIAGIVGKDDVLDFHGFNAATTTAVSGSYDSALNTTSLTVTDSANHVTETFTLTGDLSRSGWTATDDGHGGANIVDPPAATPTPVDTINATAPNQTLTGVAAGNNFVFDFASLSQGIGTGTITNFNPQHDTVEFDHFAGLKNAQELAAAIGSDSHGDAMIDLGHGDSVVFLGMTAAQLQAVAQSTVHVH